MPQCGCTRPATQLITDGSLVCDQHGNKPQHRSVRALVLRTDPDKINCALSTQHPDGTWDLPILEVRDTHKDDWDAVSDLVRISTDWTSQGTIMIPIYSNFINGKSVTTFLSVESLYDLPENIPELKWLAIYDLLGGPMGFYNKKMFAKLGLI